MTRFERVLADYRTSGLSLEAHPVHFIRESLARSGVVTTADTAFLPEGRRVRVAGIVLSRQRPATAKGLVFLSIEDETGSANVVVRPPVWQAADVQAGGGRGGFGASAAARFDRAHPGNQVDGESGNVPCSAAAVTGFLLTAFATTPA